MLRFTPLLVLPIGLLLAPVRAADPQYEDPDITPAPAGLVG